MESVSNTEGLPHPQSTHTILNTIMLKSHYFLLSKDFGEPISRYPPRLEDYFQFKRNNFLARNDVFVFKRHTQH